VCATISLTLASASAGTALPTDLRQGFAGDSLAAMLLVICARLQVLYIRL
jgi:hypothetical protein